MGKARLEAFSDGVIAIIITIMVLELAVPHEATFEAIRSLWGVFLSYVLSFIFVGIYWNNHHHLLHTVTKVTGGVMWSNLHLLFWLSLVPFVTGWMGENHFAAVPTAFYGIVMFMSAIAFTILSQAIIASQGAGSMLKKAIDRDWKGKASLGLYSAAVAVAWWLPWIACALYVAVAVMWLIPDRRIERVLDQHHS